MVDDKPAAEFQCLFDDKPVGPAMAAAAGDFKEHAEFFRKLRVRVADAARMSEDINACLKRRAVGAGDDRLNGSLSVCHNDPDAAAASVFCKRLELFKRQMGQFDSGKDFDRRVLRPRIAKRDDRPRHRFNIACIHMIGDRQGLIPC